MGLRHDLRLLADAGIITGPIATWPVAWPQVAADLAAMDESAKYPPAVSAALARVRWRVSTNQHESHARAGVYARGGSDPLFLRSFADTPRAEFEAGVFVDWMSGHLAGRIQLGYAHDPAERAQERPPIPAGASLPPDFISYEAPDGQEFRPDGSWIGVVMGNWMLSAGWMDRHWGPGWRGSLILSNNARPRPGITLRRLRTDAFKTPWLSWLGPWQFTTFVERLETDRTVRRALVWGMRIAIRPFESLEIGFSRTEMFGGEGRHVGFDTVVNVLTGQTTESNPAVGSAEQINGLGGGDIRWNLPWIDAALYGEFIGEDEKGSRPDLIMSQGGIAFWGGFGDAGASWRLVFERVDTRAALFGANETDDGGDGVAYNNHDFATGYRYRGRAIGYPADGDALLSSMRAIFVTAGGHVLTLSAATGEVNRTDGPVRFRNALTPRNEQIDVIDLAYNHLFRWGGLTLGLGYTQRDFEGGDKDQAHAWLGYSRAF
ncbi:MAG: capsule assembly Wzi family protein [Salinisphaera sp.]|nr:capsule assembly Wzi family protein [Salinisphaera sp.]